MSALAIVPVAPAPAPPAVTPRPLHYAVLAWRAGDPRLLGSQAGWQVIHTGDDHAAARQAAQDDATRHPGRPTIVMRYDSHCTAAVEASWQ